MWKSLFAVVTILIASLNAVAAAQPSDDNGLREVRMQVDELLLRAGVLPNDVEPTRDPFQRSSALDTSEPDLVGMSLDEAQTRLGTACSWWNRFNVGDFDYTIYAPAYKGSLRTLEYRLKLNEFTYRITSFEKVRLILLPAKFYWERPPELPENGFAFGTLMRARS